MQVGGRQFGGWRIRGEPENLRFRSMRGHCGPGASLSCCSALALAGPRDSCMLPVFSEVWYFKCFDILNLCWIHQVCLIPL